MTVSLLAGFESGTLAWTDLVDAELVHAGQDGTGVAEELAGKIGVLLDTEVDVAEIDRTGQLPPGLLDALRSGGFLDLTALPPHDVFRVVEAAARRSVAVGQIVAIQAGVGAAALLPILPAGPLRDHVRARTSAGAISGFGDTEHAGQNNAVRTTTATPADGGYLLNGRKLFIGNSPVADLLPVTARIQDGDRTRVGVCFVDTSDPGFEVTNRIEFMGSRGLPNGELSFVDVKVPAEHVFVDGDGAALPMSLGFVGLVGRLLFTGAPALAIARNCLDWARDFVNRRAVDGRNLGEYEEIQRNVAESVADVHAMESVARWCLAPAGLADRWFERMVAKNVLVTAAWRVVDRTVSLLGAEGLETEDSKRRRGAPALPVERAQRDARGLRIAGNVDFQLDHQAARTLLARDVPALAEPADPTGDRIGELSTANRGHVAALARHTHDFAVTCRELRANPDLFVQERRLVLVGRIAAELLVQSAVLSRAAAHPDTEDVADLCCVESAHRLADAQRRLTAENTTGPDAASISRRVLSLPQ